ncbi:MAG: hypothetical protein AB1591_12505 [Pseudomonadota bacterium]
MSSFVPPVVNDGAYGRMLGQQMRSGDSNKALGEWKAYAKKLEKSLAEMTESAYGQAGVKEAALKEIARIDPNNSLLKQDVRDAIFDKSVEDLKKKAGKTS